MIEREKKQKVCELCNGLGYYQEAKNKPVHTCMKCLREGKLG